MSHLIPHPRPGRGRTVDWRSSVIARSQSGVPQFPWPRGHGRGRRLIKGENHPHPSLRRPFLRPLLALSGSPPTSIASRPAPSGVHLSELFQDRKDCSCPSHFPRVETFCAASSWGQRRPFLASLSRRAVEWAARTTTFSLVPSFFGWIYPFPQADARLGFLS